MPLIEHPEALRTETEDPAEKLCRDFFDDIWARGNADRIDHYLAPDFRFQPPPGYSNDRDGYASLVHDMHKAFPDLFGDVGEVAACGNKVAAHWVMEGHHKGEWMGIPATGKEIRMEGLAMDKVRDGRIVWEYSAQDMLQVLAQMGVSDISGLTA